MVAALAQRRGVGSRRACSSWPRRLPWRWSVGYRTRLATIGSWVLLASLHVRLPIVLNAGDTMLRVLLFWSMFLPLGRRVVARCASRGSPRSSRLVASPATAAFMVQLALVYWAAGLGKWNEVWLSGEALAQVFAFRYYGEPLGRWLLISPRSTHWLDRGGAGARARWAVPVVHAVGERAAAAGADRSVRGVSSGDRGDDDSGAVSVGGRRRRGWR